MLQALRRILLLGKHRHTCYLRLALGDCDGSLARAALFHLSCTNLVCDSCGVYADADAGDGTEEVALPEEAAVDGDGYGEEEDGGEEEDVFAEPPTEEDGEEDGGDCLLYTSDAADE